MNIGQIPKPVETAKRKALRKNILQVLRMKTTNENKSHHLADLFVVETFRYIDFGKSDEVV